MSTEAWLALVGVAIVPIGGLVAWMFTVVRDLGMIAANTDATSKRLDSVAADGSYVRDRVDEHTEQLSALRVDITALEVSVSSLQHKV